MSDFKFNEDEPITAYPVPLSKAAQDLPMGVILDAANLAHMMHVAGLSHAVATLAEPDHECDADAYNVADAAPEDHEVTEWDVKLLLAYEESMEMVFHSMRRYMATKGYPELTLILDD
jgi:hypothetical protein